VLNAISVIFEGLKKIADDVLNNEQMDWYTNMSITLIVGNLETFL